MYHKVNPN